MHTHAAHTTTDDAMDYAEHERTYRGFLRLAKYVTFATPLLLLFIFYWTR